MRVWEYVKGCLCDLYFCAIIAFWGRFFNVSLLERLFSVILNFNVFDFLNVCNICLFKMSKCIFMSYIILYKPLAIWPPGQDMSRF